MLNSEVNDLVTQTDAGTPCGKFMRRYWQPAALAHELEGDRPVRPVRLLGEDLVLFRDNSGNLGLIARQCPHRGVDLCYGRLEDGGLRCPFHGWLFDSSGQCLEMPAEPEDSRMHEKIRQRSYPCVEKSGIIWAWMGDGEPPAFPAYDCFEAPDAYTFAFKGFLECNWLQALEVGIDPAHASFLHRFLADEDTSESYGQQFRDATANADVPITAILREFPRPRIEVEETGFGLRIHALRDLPDDAMHVRVTNQIFPHGIVIPMSRQMTITQWHVPIDDETCYWYAIFTDFSQKVDKDKMREQRLELYELPDYKPRKNKVNDYGYDPREQENATYTGMGLDINVHDQWAVESPGPVFDRTGEHLATSDKAIIAYRRMLRRAIDADVTDSLPGIPNADTNGSLTGPEAIDTLGTKANHTSIWREQDEARRQTSAWASRP